ncbi:HEAT repeat domain-containing protein [candidate division KSB1 bacterium]|nr:HEAT repeat domain-containing protein [candidate division KSB1 bacterium]
MKDCQKYRRLLPLFLYGELTANEKRGLQNHLQGCLNCQTALEKERKFQAILSRRPVLQATEKLLAQSRGRLVARLRLKRRMAFAEKVREILDSAGDWLIGALFLPRFQLAGAVALLLVGFGVGWVIFTPGEGERLPFTGPLQLTGLDGEHLFIEQLLSQPPEEDLDLHINDLGGGLVQVNLEARRNYAIQGEVTDESIRRLLSYALVKNENPGVRLRTLKALQMQKEQQDVRKVLIYSLLNDKNDGVRLRAIKALRNLPLDGELQNAFIKVLLEDKNSSIRILAIEALNQVKTEDIRPVFRVAAQQDENDYVKLLARNALIQE